MFTGNQVDSELDRLYDFYEDSAKVRHFDRARHAIAIAFYQIISPFSKPLFQVVILYTVLDSNSTHALYHLI